MRSKILLLMFFVAAFGARSAFPENTSYYLPHVASGQFNDGSFQTTFVLFNNTDSSVSVSLQLTGDNGNPLSVGLSGLGTNSQFSLTLTPGAMRFLQTDGSGSLVCGASVVTTSAPIGVSAIITHYDSDGHFITESGVGAMSLLQEVVLPVDTTGMLDTGVALYSPQGGTAVLTLFDTEGRQFGSSNNVPLGVSGHVARFITELFPSADDFAGTLVVQSSAPVGVLALRQNLSDLPFKSPPPISYTSAPVVARSGGKTTLNLAQVANGAFDAGKYTTSFLLSNISSTPAEVTLALTEDDGTPFVVTIPNKGTGSSFSFTLAPGASTRVETDGVGPLTSGAAVINSNVPIGASTILTILDPEGYFLTEAGVGDSEALSQFTLPVDVAGTFNTGIAFYNPATAAVSLTLRLLDANGVVAGTTELALPPKSHAARFASDLFPGPSYFRGSIAVTSTGKVAAVVLRQKMAAGTPTYTALQVTPGVSRGTTPGNALLTKTETGVAATSNLTLNATLQAGFKLTGTANAGDVRFWGVSAQSGENVFSGTVDLSAQKYLIVVPPGSYTLTAWYHPRVDPNLSRLSVTTNAGTVQVSGDTTKDINLPAVDLFSVSGTVAGLGTLLASGRSIWFYSADKGAGLNLDAGGAWQGLLPTGTFSAGISGYGQNQADEITIAT